MRVLKLGISAIVITLSALSVMFSCKATTRTGHANAVKRQILAAHPTLPSSTWRACFVTVCLVLRNLLGLV